MKKLTRKSIEPYTDKLLKLITALEDTPKLDELKLDQLDELLVLLKRVYGLAEKHINITNEIYREHLQAFLDALKSHDNFSDVCEL
tara:strand:- start:2280 stop:2537 length:258 start_codon:yes stop_codon:yes gene_type:complete